MTGLIDLANGPEIYPTALEPNGQDDIDFDIDLHGFDETYAAFLSGIGPAGEEQLPGYGVDERSDPKRERSKSPHDKYPNKKHGPPASTQHTLQDIGPPVWLEPSGSAHVPATETGSATQHTPLQSPLKAHYLLNADIRTIIDELAPQTIAALVQRLYGNLNDEAIRKIEGTSYGMNGAYELVDGKEIQSARIGGVGEITSKYSTAISNFDARLREGNHTLMSALSDFRRYKTLLGELPEFGHCRINKLLQEKCFPELTAPRILANMLNLDSSSHSTAIKNTRGLDSYVNTMHMHFMNNNVVAGESLYSVEQFISHMELIAKLYPKNTKLKGIWNDWRPVAHPLPLDKLATVAKTRYATPKTRRSYNLTCYKIAEYAYINNITPAMFYSQLKTATRWNAYKTLEKASGPDLTKLEAYCTPTSTQTPGDKPPRDVDHLTPLMDHFMGNLELVSTTLGVAPSAET